MKLKETVRRIWRKAEAFAAALDYDPHAEVSLRVQRLERDCQSQWTRLEANRHSCISRTNSASAVENPLDLASAVLERSG
jgi:hypothetical protein